MGKGLSSYFLSTYLKNKDGLFHRCSADLMKQQVKAHDKLGMQTVPLSLLTPYETKELSLDLLKNMNPNDPHNKRNRGKIVLELTFNPFKEEHDRFSGFTVEGKNSIIRRSSTNLSSNGGVLSVTIENAEDVEGKHHSNPYALLLFRGEYKKTKVWFIY